MTIGVGIIGCGVATTDDMSGRALSKGPAMSIVLGGADLEETRSVRTCFRSQSVARRLELVLVLPATVEAPATGELFEGFWGGRIVRVGAIHSRGGVNAAGVRAARAPIVVLAEDHSYPEPGWAEALIADHRGPWAAVGPVVRNANPGTLHSWADFVIGYGPWSTTRDAGEADFLPGHNSSYKVDVLLEYEADLEAMLSNETVLQWSLLRAGHHLLLSGDAVVRHLNFLVPSVFRRVQVLNGRNFAGFRAAGWGSGRRAVFVLGSPLIPFVRAWRSRRRFGGPGKGAERSHAPWRAWPIFFLGLCLDAFGQAQGYAFGSGPKAELAHYEFCRSRFVLPSESEALESQAAIER